MKSYEATVRIKAMPEAIWPLLTDAAGFSDWDSGLRVEGEIAAGEKIKVYSEDNLARGRTLRVTALEPERTMTWRRRVPPRLFCRVRTFSLFPAARGTTRFTVREECTGLLLPLLRRWLPDLGPSFEHLAHGLKKRAEGPPAGSAPRSPR